MKILTKIDSFCGLRNGVTSIVYINLTGLFGDVFQQVSYKTEICLAFTRGKWFEWEWSQISGSEPIFLFPFYIQKDKMYLLEK